MARPCADTGINFSSVASTYGPGGVMQLPQPHTGRRKSLLCLLRKASFGRACDMQRLIVVLGRRASFGWPLPARHVHAAGLRAARETFRKAWIPQEKRMFPEKAGLGGTRRAPPPSAKRQECAMKCALRVHAQARRRKKTKHCLYG